MIHLLKYWKPAAIVLIVVVFAVSCQVQKSGTKAKVDAAYERGYDVGYQRAALEIAGRLKDAAIKQAAEAREREKKARESFARKQANIEKEKQHAETVITDLRRELSRVQQHAAAARNQSSRRNLSAADKAAAAPDETAAKGWILFAESAARYAELAEIADRQRNDLAEWQAYGTTVAGE